MIISVAFPNMAFKRPPTVGPVKNASCSVTKPACSANSVIPNKLKKENPSLKCIDML